jgi:sugar lactone lactonase YvrE
MYRTQRSLRRAAASATITAFSVALIAVAPTEAAPAKEETLQTLVSYDFSRGETPESIAVAHNGTIYVSLAFAGQIEIRPRRGSVRRAQLPSAGEGTFTAAIALDQKGRAFVPVNSVDPAIAGVWRIDPDGESQRVATVPAGTNGNGIAFDTRGNLYVADSLAGTIYQLPRGADTVRTWITDPLLEPDPTQTVEGIPFPGANGVQIFRGDLYVANSAQGNVLRIPINPDGRPGTIDIAYPGVIADDFAFDVRGNLYVTTDPFQTVERVTPEGNRTILADKTDGVDGPSALAFGTGSERRSVYITNLGFFGATHQPSVQKLYVGVPGAPR